MEDQYSNLSVDLRQFINRTNNTTSSQFMQPIPLTPQGVPSLPTVLPDFFSTHHQQQQQPSFLNLISPPPFHHRHHYATAMNGRHVTDMLSRDVDVGMNSNGGGGLMTFNHHHHEFGSDSTTTTTPNGTGGTNSGGAATVGANNLCGFDVEEGVGGGGGNSGGTGSIGGVCIGTGGGGSEVGTARWPRQETLTLLEIRSRLDRKFKEANQKGPLWDEVSRIMYEENGYQRSGKKCREKFENLYKYYKKTKEGKAGRQDGKHYRFFRQLEALYGTEPASTVPLSSTTTIPPPLSVAGNTDNSLPTFSHQQISSCSTHHQITPRQHQLCLCDNSTVSLSNTSSIFHTSSSFSSDDNDDDDDDNNYDDDGPNDDDLSIAVASSMENNNNSNDNNNKNINDGGILKVGMKGGNSSGNTNKRRRKRSNWKCKVKEFLDKQTKKLMEKQESWLERMMKALERKEEERNLREEEWRKQDIERMEQEHKFWANERAWIEARDAALLDALHKLNDKDEAKLVANDVEQVMLAHQQQRHLLLLQQQQAANHQAGTGSNAAATATHQGDHGSNQHHEHHRPAEGWIF